MSFLLNKRKRDDSSNESLSLPNNDTSKNNQENNNNININIPEEENLIEENNIENTKNNANNKIDPFQMMFQSINSRKEDQNNNMILSPLCSNVFFGSFKKMKNYDKIMGSNFKSGMLLSKSNSSFIKNKKGKMFFTPSSYEMENNFNFETFFNNNNINNNEKMNINLDLDIFNVSEKKNIFDVTHLENKLNNDKDAINDINNINNEIFPMKQQDNIFFDNIKNSSMNNFTFNSCLEKNNKEKNMKKSFQKIYRPKNLDTFFSFKKPFRTFRTKLIVRNSHCLHLKKKSNKPKIFHIEKIFNKKEYKEVHEKDATLPQKNNFIDKYKISLKKIKQIYLNSCLKIYSYLTEKNKYDESNLNNDVYVAEIIRQVSDIIRAKKISSSKMNEILQVSDDDKYRKHYFMFSSEAKQFCLDLITKKKYPLDITMKMCKVPRKSLRRWANVGCLRKKGCGRKTKNPKMEEKLLMWYNDKIKNNVNITAKMIRDKAVEISNDKDFLASKGWLEKFKKKNGIQIMSNKRHKKECEEFNRKENNNTRNNNSINNISLNESGKEGEKDDYEINIISENKRKKHENENDSTFEKNKRIKFDDKENTNTNIFK